MVMLTAGLCAAFSFAAAMLNPSIPWQMRTMMIATSLASYVTLLAQAGR